MYTQRVDLLGLDTSTFTSNPLLVADFRDMSLSIQTSTASASNITIQGTNVDGFTAAIPNGAWSTLTVIGTAGIQTVDPGIRWLRAIRDAIAVSANSNTTVSLQGKALT